MTITLLDAGIVDLHDKGRHITMYYATETKKTHKNIHDTMDKFEKLEIGKAGLVQGTWRIGTKWTSVEDEPLADITIKRDGMSTTVTYDNYLVGVDMLFAVPLGNGEYSICRGYIEDDGTIQESFQSGDNELWGYSLQDVTHYMQIFNPE